MVAMMEESTVLATLSTSLHVDRKGKGQLAPLLSLILGPQLEQGKRAANSLVLQVNVNLACLTSLYLPLHLESNTTMLSPHV